MITSMAPTLRLLRLDETCHNINKIGVCTYLTILRIFLTIYYILFKNNIGQ